MLDFKEIKIEDYKYFKPSCLYEQEFSCENTFLNLLVWQEAYNNMFAIEDDILFVKSGKAEKQTFFLPFGKDFDKGMRLIQEYADTERPNFWVQDGPRFERFKESYAKGYKITEVRKNFDYIYLQTDLAHLTGKKYHSKRNHINAFSKLYDWEYRNIDKSNIDDIKVCCEKWYKENLDKADFTMGYEKNGIYKLLDNFSALNILGGAIYINGKVVAFTLGTPINSDCFDIAIEKALTEYSSAYTLINREFAKNCLGSYKYINREDDLGLEGLRKSKLSYNPDFLLKKYIATAEE